ncbi:MAG: 30S ribosomal protein S5 [Candidatus Nitrosopelagicus sp.]|nr:30S ribosomal protein S5 [Candidatus Nitrosopelagicus sp.]
MSIEKTVKKTPQQQQSRGGFGGRPGGPGGRPGGPGGRPGGPGGRGGRQGDRPRRPRREPVVEVWEPKTILGKKVASDEITTMEEIYEKGYRIQEAGIIKKLLPDLKTEVIDVGLIQKMTPNGQSTRFKALVAAGNQNGWLGIGLGKSKQMRIAIEKANNAAFLNVSPIKLGCGSWECRCDEKHSVPFTVKGKGGSVTIQILPGPRGLGLVAGGKIRNLLKLAGVKDAWTHTNGSTATMNSTSKALLECLRQTFSQG